MIPSLSFDVLESGSSLIFPWQKELFHEMDSTVARGSGATSQ